MKPIPYFTFQGDCMDAMTAYAAIFGGTLHAPMRARDAAEHYPPPRGKEDWVMHIGLAFADGGMIYGSDDIMGGTEQMTGVSTLMEFPTVGDGQTAFDALAAGGVVQIPYGPTFWSPAFGVVRDRWGTQWMISTTEPMPG